VVAGGVLAQADVVTRLEGALAQALEANEQLVALVSGSARRSRGCASS
jgi:hypothetical protein